jgi:RNA polymerase sigma-70 factor (ECF subfamily)
VTVWKRIWILGYRDIILASLVTSAAQKASSGMGHPHSGSNPKEPRHVVPRDPASFWEMTCDWRPYLKAVAAGVLDDDVVRKVDPSDVVQTALVAAVEGLAAFRGQTIQEWQAWIIAIVRNEARQVRRHWRRQRRDVECEQPLPDGSEAGPRLAATESSPSFNAMRRERASRLLIAISKLGPQDQKIIELRHFAGLSHEETAARMGKSPAAVRKLWGRALARLREKLNAEQSSVGRPP